MKRLFFYLVCLFLMMFLLPGFGQDAKLKRVAGVVVDQQTMEPVPYAAVMIKNDLRGTIADEAGFFAILAYEHDTLVFSHTDPQPDYFIIPVEVDNLDQTSMKIIDGDTIYLPDLYLESYRERFLPNGNGWEDGFKVKDDFFIKSSGMRSSLRGWLHEQQQREFLYYNDQFRYSFQENLNGFMPPNNLINPASWIEFIRDLNEGKYNHALPYELPHVSEPF
jgi:hypothetical protein